MGRVTRSNNRRRNWLRTRGELWLVLGNRAPFECVHATHEKEYARLVAEFQLFGPFEGVRSFEQCGCEFICVPESVL